MFNRCGRGNSGESLCVAFVQLAMKSQAFLQSLETHPHGRKLQPQCPQILPAVVLHGSRDIHRRIGEVCHGANTIVNPLLELPEFLARHVGLDGLLSHTG